MRIWPFRKKKGERRLQDEAHLREDERRRLLDRMPKGGVVAEVGVWKGDFSEEILRRTSPSRLHLIDPWAFAPELPSRWYGGLSARSQEDMDNIYASALNRFSDNPKVRTHRTVSDKITELFSEEYFDWIYIDGDHSYWSVLSDLRNCWPLIKPGGFLAGDDFIWVDRDNGDRQSVKEAVEKFAAELGMRPEILGSQFWFCKREA